MCRWCLGRVSVMCSDCVVMFWWYVGDALVLCWWCLCSVSVMLWCLSDGWWCCGDVFVMVLWCFGDEYWWTFSNFQWVPKQNEWLFDVSLLLGSHAGLIVVVVMLMLMLMLLFSMLMLMSMLLLLLLVLLLLLLLLRRRRRRWWWCFFFSNGIIWLAFQQLWLSSHMGTFKPLSSWSAQLPRLKVETCPVFRFPVTPVKTYELLLRGFNFTE